MPQYSPEQHHAIMAAVDALLMQVIMRVPFYQHAAGTVLVPLHFLLETAELDVLLAARVLTLLHVHTGTLAQGGTVLLVPLGEALALLLLSQYFLDALTHGSADHGGAHDSRDPWCSRVARLTVMNTPRCPRCGAAEPARTRRRLWERLLAPAAIYPFRCRCCGCRFRWRQRGMRYSRAVHPLRW
jgi:hypothetical protein